MTQMDEKTQAEFTKELLSLCDEMRIQSKIYMEKKNLSGRAYDPRYLRKSISLNGGYSAARKLISSPSFSKGLQELASQEMLDLSLEAFILKPEWSIYFTDEELESAMAHLAYFEAK